MFFCVENYHIRKGYEELFRAIHIVRKQVGKRFVVYLRTGKRSHIDKAVENLRDVTVVKQSKASHFEVALEMMACDCYLAPSLAEGFYLPALKAAFGCGKPVIYPNTSPYTDYLDQEVGYPIDLVDKEIKKYQIEPFNPIVNSFKMRYWDVEEFVRAMIRILERPMEAFAKGRSAYHERSKWTISNVYEI